MNYSFLKSYARQITVSTAAGSIIIFMICFFSGFIPFGKAFLFSSFTGLAGFFFQVVGVQRLFNNKISLLHFIALVFRLACLGFLIYAFIVWFGFKPVAVAFGLVFPVICACGVVIFKDIKGISD